LGETNTKKLKLVGEDVNLEVITYWNDASKKAYVDVSGLPKAPEGKCYQLWADVHGEMLSVGVLAKADDASSFSEVAHYAEAESLNITLEDLPGSDHATVSALVTSTPV